MKIPNEFTAYYRDTSYSCSLLLSLEEIGNGINHQPKKDVHQLKAKKEKKNVVWFKMTLLHNEEKLNQEICNQMNGTRKYAEWGSSGPERQIPHVLS